MRAVFYALFAFFSFTLMDVSIKWLLEYYSLGQVIFLNAAFALIFISATVSRTPEVLKTSRPMLHLKRAVLLFVVDALAFYSYGQVPLAEAYSLILTMPIFTAVLAAALKLEPFGKDRLFAVLVGFSGVLLVLAPGFGAINIALLFALMSAGLEAVAFLMVVKHRDEEHPLAFAFYGLAFMTLAIWLIPGWTFEPLTREAIFVAVGGGLCYALAMGFVLSAFNLGSPTIVSSMQYSQLVWGMAIGVLFWGEMPADRALIGAAIITVSALALIAIRGKKSEVSEA